MYQKKSMSKKLVVIITACAVSFFGLLNFVTTAVLAYIYADYAELPSTTILMIMTITPLTALLTSFLIGPISMKITQKNLLIIAMLCTIGAGMIFVFGGGKCSYSLIIFAAAICGIVAGIVCTIPSAIVTEYAIDNKEGGKLNGYVNASMQGGALVMSLFGGYLGTIKWTYAYILYFLAIPVLIFVLVAFPNEKLQMKDKSRVKQKSKIPLKAIFICLHYALLFIAFFTFSISISSYIITEYKLGTSLQTGIISAVMTLCGLIAGLTYGKYARILNKWLMPFMCLLIVAGYVTTTFFTGSLIGCLIGAVLLGFSKTAVAPYAIGAISRTVPRHMISVSISLLMGCMNLGMFLSEYVTNILSVPFGGATIFNKFFTSIIVGVLCLIYAIILYVIWDRIKAEGELKDTVVY